MKCKNCQTNEGVKYSKYTAGEFCSKECARSYSTKEKRNEINKKVSTTLKGKLTRKRKLTEDEKKMMMLNQKKTWDDKILKSNFDSLSIWRQRKRLILEQKNKCVRCNNDKWMGEPLTLEIDHIDGDISNNTRENLVGLCPNCHSLTPTWRGRNKKDKKKKISDIDLLDSLLVNDFNMRQSLISVGLAPKGGNYKRCHKLKKIYEEIKS